MRCRFCGWDNWEEALFCEQCGKKLEVSNITGNGASQGGSGNVKICPVCLFQNEPEAMFCQECGTPFEDPRQQELRNRRIYPEPPQSERVRKPARSSSSRTSQRTADNNSRLRKKRRNKKVLPFVIGFSALGIAVVLGVLFLPKLLKPVKEEISGSGEDTAVVADSNSTTGSEVASESSSNSGALGDSDSSAMPVATNTPVPAYTEAPMPSPTPVPTVAPTQPLAPTQPAASTGVYLLPGVDSRYLTEAELMAMPLQALRYARNEIFARHGRKFDSAELSGWFNQQSWYQGTISGDNFNDSVLNSYEKANADLVAGIEGGRYQLDQGNYSYAAVYQYLEQRDGTGNAGEGLAH